MLQNVLHVVAGADKGSFPRTLTSASRVVSGLRAMVAPSCSVASTDSIHLLGEPDNIKRSGCKAAPGAHALAASSSTTELATTANGSTGAFRYSLQFLEHPGQVPHRKESRLEGDPWLKREHTRAVESSVTCSSRTLSRGAKEAHTASPAPVTCVERDASGRDQSTRRARRDP